MNFYEKLSEDFDRDYKEEDFEGESGQEFYKIEHLKMLYGIFNTLSEIKEKMR